MVKARRALWMGVVAGLVVAGSSGAALAAGEVPSQWQGMMIESADGFVGWLLNLIVQLLSP